MDTTGKIEMLGEAARYDLCAEGCGTAANRVRDDIGRWIYPAVMPDGRRIKLLKVLQTNACEKDCFYCAQRASRDCRRTGFAPDELAHLFEQLLLAGRVTGLFLSSSVCGGSGRTQERMIDTVEIIRKKQGFQGYIHLKILPGVQRAAIERAVALADRVSINLEAPNAARLERLTGTKEFGGELLSRLGWASEVLREAAYRPRGRWGGGRAGLTTQFVVGGAGEPDREIMATTSRLYSQLRLRRAYYSAFQPVPDTPLEGHAPVAPLREHRLYQSDWLLRQYGFGFGELVFDQDGNLPMEADPKRIWADRHPERYPIEVNRASREMLLRIPGVGPRSASRIVDLRGETKFRELADLKKVGAVAERAAPYVLLDGRRPPAQLSLW